MHRAFVPSLGRSVGAEVELTGDEASHALRVRRLAAGDRMELMDGRGCSAVARIVRTRKQRSGWVLAASIESVRELPKLVPAVAVVTAVPKGPRLEGMIEGLSQCGAASWRGLVCERSVVDPRAGKIERVERVAMESAKQCGRGHVMEIGPTVEGLASVAERGPAVVMADPSGEPLRRADGEAGAVTLLVGPEGGWSERELELGLRQGWAVRSVGPLIMRIETAAIVGCGVLMCGSRQGL